MLRQNRLQLSLLTALTAVLLAVLVSASTVRAAIPAAQPVLVEASPAPGAVLGSSPESITLTFDRALADQGSRLTVTNSSGEIVSNDRGSVDPSDRFLLMTAVPALPEGRYRVAYQARGIGGSTFISGAYQFTVDLPEPRLDLLNPINGQAFNGPDIPLEMQVDFFDFGVYDNRIRLYLDGELVDEIHGNAYTLEGVEPGVHELRVVLARFEGEELPQTAQHVTIAVAQPGAQAPAPASHDVEASHTGIALTPLQWVGFAVLTLLLLGIGFWLGRAVTPPVTFTPAPGEDERPR